MSAAARFFAVIVATVGVAACSFSGLTFDLVGTGGAASTTSAGTSASVSAGVSSGASTGSAMPAACGNGVVDPGEQCDDANQEPLDGCSPSCTIDELDACPGALVPLTPAGRTINDTLVGKGQDVIPGCGTDTADVIYAVVPSVSGTLTATLAATDAQQRVVAIQATCGGSASTSLACAQSGNPTVQIWAHAGVTYWVVVAGGAAPFTLDLKLSPCGNGVVEGLEECDDPQNPACVGCLLCAKNGEVMDPASKHCYLVQAGNTKPWASARSSCLAWGGDLVAPSSAAELAFVSGLVGKSVWIGGYAVTPNCEFAWTNGEPWRAHWLSGEPGDSGNGSETSVYLNPNGGAMSDVSGVFPLGYVCERSPAGSCGDGIVQPGEECDDAVISPYFDCAGCKLACKAGELEDPATRHCYRVVSTPLDAASAANACKAIGGYLAAITSAQENAVIHAQVGAQAWIGLSNAQQGTWSNGDPVCFEDPANGGFQKGCWTMLADGTWSSLSCASAVGYVCERDN
jgi:cysteine-rich repeat protein